MIVLQTDQIYTRFSFSKKPLVILGFYFATFVFTSFIKLHAQKVVASSAATTFLDAHYGKNNQDVFNGPRFYDLYGSTPKNYRYFHDYKSDQGTVVYDGQNYSNIPMHYDLVEDQLIIYSDEKSSFFKVKLDNEKVSSFTLYNTLFKKEDLSKNYNLDKNAFYEIAYSGTSLDLLIARAKYPEAKKRNTRVYYEFRTTVEFWIKNGNEYLEIDSARDLKKNFPENKKDVNQFYKSYRTLRRTNYKKFMQNLTSLLDRLVSN